MTPELPDNPDAEQVEAWVELAELSQDPDFRASMRRMAQQHAADRAQRGNRALRRDAAAVVRDEAGLALVAGTDPASPEAGPVVAAAPAPYAHRLRRPAHGDLRRRLRTRLQTADDPRREPCLHMRSGS